jgi:hypothetical protein
MMHPDTEVRFISDAVGYGVFALRAMATWDSMVAESFGYIGTVGQQLWPLSTDAAEIEAILRGELPIPSCAFVQIRE